jgi:hypothetical protein
MGDNPRHFQPFLLFRVVQNVLLRTARTLKRKKGSLALFFSEPQWQRFLKLIMNFRKLFFDATAIGGVTFGGDAENSGISVAIFVSRIRLEVCQRLRIA